jgi:hypothetical protein
MFGLHKKKSEQPPAQETQSPAQSQAYKALAEEFPGEETDLLAVTGSAPLDTEPVGEDGLWHVSMGVTAWKDVYDQELHQGEARLETLVDDQLLEYLRSRLPRDFLIQATVRPDETGMRFLMTGLPQSAFDAELKAILEEQKTPVTLDVPELGSFTLSRAMNWFQGELDWVDSTVTIMFDQGDDQEDSQAVARAVLAERESWDQKTRQLAALQTLEQVNEALGEDGPVTAQELEDALGFESIRACADGTLEIELQCDELLWGRGVRVEATLHGGPTTACLED